MGSDIERGEIIHAEMRFSDKRVFDQIAAMASQSTVTQKEIDEAREDLKTRIVTKGRLRLARELEEMNHGQSKVIPFRPKP